MEISKNLQEEIVAVQQKLQRAILEHQICVEKLKDDPNNPNILGQIEKIQVYIVSLGRCQKQIVQRLRKEVDALNADNANGSKVSIPSLLGLNNNNHITNNNETKHETAANGFETKPSKEDYEEIIKNGDVHSQPRDNDCPNLRPSSVETVSGEDEIVEVSLDENSDDKQEEMQKEHNVELSEKYNYLNCLGLITKSKCIELQNRRVERKRRSTANPQFVYSMFEQPSKRKRHSYLQSGNAPHTRQATARMNGPSPPPNKTQPTKSTSPPVQTAITKSLIPIQKSTTRPNILRNADSKVFVNKNKIEDQTRLPISSAKSVQSIGNKTVHIPGLPSSLTIERIGSDSIVCISCENPGSLTMCRNCSNSYHVSCHIRSTPPSKTCPKCVSLDEEDNKDEEVDIKEEVEDENKLLHYKKDEKFATTTNASGFVGEAREDTEINKASGGLYKADTAQKKHILPTVFGVNQLPASTFLIPITANDVSTSSVNESQDNKFTSNFDNEHRQDTIHSNYHIANHCSRPSVTCAQENQMSYSQLPNNTTQSEKYQSYLIVKKITESSGRSNQSSSSETEDQNCSTVFNYQLSNSCRTTVQTGVQPIITHSLFNNSTKQINRTTPFHVTVPKLSNSIFSLSNELDRAVLNGRKPWAKLTCGNLCINQSAKSNTEILLSSYDNIKSSSNEQQRPKSTGSAEEAVANLDSHCKYRSRNFIHSLFPGHNKSHIITSSARESRSFSSNDRDCPLLRQQLSRKEHELVLYEQSDSKPEPIQFQRRGLTRFFEHVKLEEAHISAPLRTKLAPKNENDKITREDSTHNKQHDDSAVTQTALLTSRDVDENRLVIQVPWIADDSENVCNEANVASKTLVRRFSDTALVKTSDYEHVDLQSMTLRRHSAEQENNRLKIATATATLHIAQNNLSELRNEVSVPDNKADTERQDLSSGGQLRRRSNSSSSSSSGHSDTPEQAMNVTDLEKELNNFLADFVSEEKNEKLEQIGEKSATVSEADATTG